MTILTNMMLALLLPGMMPQGQTASPPSTAAETPTAGASDDIIVRALRLPREQLPTQVYWNQAAIFQGRIARERATTYLRCAISGGKRAYLRQVVDGEPNSARARAAQGMIVLHGSGCQPGLPQRSGGTNRDITIAEYGENTLHRGIIVELALKNFAAEAELTREQTADPQVRARYDMREFARNRLRLPNDRDAWVVSSCLVREQPELATRLTRSSPGSMLERGLVQALLIEGRVCLGPVKRLTIDPSNFRGYVVDSYYRWLEAAGNVASLIPAG